MGEELGACVMIELTTIHGSKVWLNLATAWAVVDHAYTNAAGQGSKSIVQYSDETNFYIQESVQEIMAKFNSPQVAPAKTRGCTVCFGSGGKKTDPCANCKGTGRIPT